MKLPRDMAFEIWVHLFPRRTIITGHYQFADSDGTVRAHTGRLVRTQKMTERTTGFAIEFDPE